MKNLKLNNKQIETLAIVTEKIKNKKMPISVGLILSANYETIQPLVNIYKQAKDVLLKKHTVLNENGDPITIRNHSGEFYKIDDPEKLDKEMQQASATEFEVNITKVPVGQIELFGSEKYDALTLEEVASLRDVIEAEEGVKGEGQC